MLEQAKAHNAALTNVTWIHGDGATLTDVESGSATVCFSHVVFQHIDDPRVTLAYIRDMGRVLGPGGWAAFQISNDSELIERRRRAGRPLKMRLQTLLGRAPRGQEHPAWLGSHVELSDLREAADDGGMDVERVAGEGTQFCMVLCRKRPAGA
jgi:SAM-dependent methyltransferase